MALSARDYERCVKMLTKNAYKLTNGGYPCAVVYSTRSGALKQMGSKVLGELVRQNAPEFLRKENWMEEDRCAQGTVLPPMEGPFEKLTLCRLRSLIPELLSAEFGNKRPVYQDSSRPVWWPEEIPFVNIRQKPETVASGSDWRNMLIKVVERCYAHYQEQGLQEEEEDEGEDSTEELVAPEKELRAMQQAATPSRLIATSQDPQCLQDRSPNAQHSHNRCLQVPLYSSPAGYSVTTTPRHSRHFPVRTQSPLQRPVSALVRQEDSRVACCKRLRLEYTPKQKRIRKAKQVFTPS